MPVSIVTKQNIHDPKQQWPRKSRAIVLFHSYDYAFRLLLALNLTTFRAGILISFPVCGFLPFRAAFW